jgi:ABC-2 type transport system permease protein
MSADVVESPRDPRAPAPAEAGPARPSSIPRGATWRLTWHGLRTVAVLELRQRVRSTRWVIVLALWFVLLGGLTTLIRFAVHRALDPGQLTGGTVDAVAVQAATDRAAQAAGAMMFGIILFLVLGLAGLVAPALTATSVNGDRAAGVLATLQTTLLSAAEIAVGKLLAAWATAMALLAAATPFILWAYLEGGTSAGRLLVTVALLAVMLLVVCAMALGWSALTARTSTSAVLTYLSVVLLGLGLPMLFGVMVPLVSSNESVRVYQSEPVNQDPTQTNPTPTDPTQTDPTQTDPTQTDPGTTYSCQVQVQTMSRAHTERVWWLLAANPFVILADAAPRPPAGSNDAFGDDPLTAIRTGVREARLGPPAVEDWCTGTSYALTDPATGAQVGSPLPVPPELVAAQDRRNAQLNGLGVVWPFGLAADLVLAAGFVVLAILRLRAPARALRRGTRVA